MQANRPEAMAATVCLRLLMAHYGGQLPTATPLQLPDTSVVPSGAMVPVNSAMQERQRTFVAVLADGLDRLPIVQHLSKLTTGFDKGKLINTVDGLDACVERAMRAIGLNGEQFPAVQILIQSYAIIGMAVIGNSACSIHLRGMPGNDGPEWFVADLPRNIEDMPLQLL